MRADDEGGVPVPAPEGQAAASPAAASGPALSTTTALRRRRALRWCGAWRWCGASWWRRDWGSRGRRITAAKPAASRRAQLGVQILRRESEHVVRSRRDADAHARPEIEPRERALLRLRVPHVRIVRSHASLEACP